MTYPSPVDGLTAAVTVPSATPVCPEQPVTRDIPSLLGEAETPTTPPAEVASAGHVEFDGAADTPPGAIDTLIDVAPGADRTRSTGALAADTTVPPTTVAVYPLGYSTAGTATSLSDSGGNEPLPFARRDEYRTEHALLVESKLQPAGVPDTNWGYGRARAPT